MNRDCPVCGYPLHRTDHPHIQVVRFCRERCRQEWMYEHGLITSSRYVDPLPTEIDRRRSA